MLQILEYVICFACKSTNSTQNYTANWMANIAYNHKSCEPTDSYSRRHDDPIESHDLHVTKLYLSPGRGARIDIQPLLAKW